MGHDGWLFLQGDRNDAVGQHTGRVKYSAKDKEMLAALLHKRTRTIEQSGAIWLTAVVPDKEMVYAEYLPPEIVPVDQRPVHDFLDISAAQGAPAIYLLDDLRRASVEDELYIKTDTHWNHKGAYAAYLAICHELSSLEIEVDVVDASSIEWMEETSYGDLGSKLYPDQVQATNVVARLEPSLGRLVFDNAVRNHGRVLIYEQERKDRPTCMVFGESFAPNILFFLRESFRRLVFVHTNMLVGELVARERPDVVLNLPVERFLIKVPDDHEALAKIAATVREKGGELPWASKPHTIPQ